MSRPDEPAPDERRAFAEGAPPCPECHDAPCAEGGGPCRLCAAEIARPGADADAAPAVTGPLRVAAVGGCECCGGPDEDAAQHVFDVLARASTVTLCRPCLETLAAAIDAALASKETSP